ncbi:uncharacterized protein LOC142326049 [Lycorma delicatula]|uniref:uncharacterized protein LOC142326049 n=1 Tax=Lycorma delicatula TaxID=130591 RepID=UPI003F516346
MSKYNIAHELGSKPRTKDVLLPEGEDLDFSSMLLPQTILQGLDLAGFVKPSPIQLKAIPLARCGFDLIVQAKSGTGKTCVFAVAALESVILKSNRLQVIVLAPTREIAQQIQHVISTIGCTLKNLKAKTFIGGVPVSEDILNVANCQIAVGAPGRIRHLLEDKLLSPEAVRLLIFDEADKLMEEIFQTDIRFIFEQLPESKQVIACSATYSQNLLHFLGNFMQSATHVTPDQDPSPILIGLRHFVCIEPRSLNNISKLQHKEIGLLKILKNVSFLQCLVFSNHFNRAESICNHLKRKGWQATWIAGKQDQKTRTTVMTNVKDLKVRILVTTDLTARGIDLHEVNLVINMDIPTDHHTYLHRMGRAGRYGGHGIVITIITEEEVKKFKQLLGAIGDSYASAYVIPDCELSDKLWKNDFSHYEQIIGILNDDDDDNNKLSVEIEDEGNFRQVKGNNTDCINLRHVELHNELDDIKNVEILNDSNSCVTDMTKLDPDNNSPVNSRTTEECGFDKNAKSEIKNEKYVEMNENYSYINDKEDSESSSYSADTNSNAEKFSECGSDDNREDNNEQNYLHSTETDSESDNFGIERFGLKLLHYYGCSPDILHPYSLLDSSLNSFIDNKCDIEDINRRLLEPKGTLDTEIVENFSRKSMNDYNSLMHICQNFGADLVVNSLLNNATTDILSEAFGNLKKADKVPINESKCKDPELYLSSDNSSGENLDKLVEIENDGESVSKLSNSFDKLNVNNKETEFEIDKKIKSDLENSDEEKSAIHSDIKENSESEERNDKDVLVENDKKSIGKRLFTREEKKNRKRKNIFSSINLSQIDNNNEAINKRLYQNDNLKKAKQTGSVSCAVSSSDFSSAPSVSGINNNNNNHSFQTNSNNQKLHQSAYHFQHEYNCPYAEQYNTSRSHSANPNQYNINNMPVEVRNWYNMWYNQASYIQWYVSYNKYIKSMLNPKQ